MIGQASVKLLRYLVALQPVLLDPCAVSVLQCIWTFLEKASQAHKLIAEGEVAGEELVQSC